jgi:hypothetical protein
MSPSTEILGKRKILMNPSSGRRASSEKKKYELEMNHGTTATAKFVG